MKFSFSPIDTSKATLGLMSQWRERAAAIQAKIARDTAEAGLKNLLGRIPQSQDTVEYRRSMEVAQVVDNNKKIVTYEIRSNPKSKNIRQINTDRTLLFIQPKRTLRHTKPEIEILHKFSPWTPDSLPFKPNSIDATTIYRKVSKREFDLAAKDIKDKQGEWKPQLNRLGIKLGKGIIGLGSMKVVQDTMYTMNRLEFGIGGKASPHWRPMVKYLETGGGGLKVLKDPAIDQALSDPKYMKWKAWTNRYKTSISGKDQVQLDDFQKKLKLGTVPGS